MGTTAVVQGSAEKRELSWRSKSEREREAPKSKIERSPSSKAANVDV